MKANARGRAAVRALPLACLLVLVVAGSARAEDPTYGNRTFDRSPAEGFPGTVIQVSGTGCSENGKPYQTASVRLVNPHFTTPFTEYPIRSDGTWSGEFAIPRQAPPGDYRLRANCNADDMVFLMADQDFKVIDPSPPTSSPPITSPPTSSPPASPPTSRTATSKAVTSSSPPPSTDPPPTSPPAEPIPETLPSLPVAASVPPEEPPKRPPGGGSFPVVPAAAALLAVGGAGAVWQIRRRRTASKL